MPVLACGRYRGNVFTDGFVRFSALRFHDGFECLEDDRACLGRQPGADDEAAIIVAVISQFASGMAGHGLFALGEPAGAVISESGSWCPVTLNPRALVSDPASGRSARA